MRIGVVSDTHDQRTNVARIVELFNEADVARVVHTGDITTTATLELLARLEVPLFGVYGNNDVDRDALAGATQALGLEFLEPPQVLTWAGRQILVTHDPESLPTEPGADIDVLLHGHDHRHASDTSAGYLRFNPGECAGHVPGLNSIGILDLESLRTERLRF